MRHTKKIIIWARRGSLSVFNGPTFAQGATFTCQGLRTGNGTPAQSQYGAAFSPCATSSGGNAVSGNRGFNLWFVGATRSGPVFQWSGGERTA